MGVMAMAMLAFWLIKCSMLGAALAPCPPDTVDINITLPADVQGLVDALSCVGRGMFSVAWHASLTIDERIEVSGAKDVTVTGVSSPTFPGTLGDDDAASVIIDAGRGPGIFSVSDGSTLRLNNIVLEGGNAENGGAVEVIFSSALFVFGCTFISNNASNGGVLYAYNSAIYVNGNTSFYDNSALVGGVMLAFNSVVDVNDNTLFDGNSAQFGGVLNAYNSTIYVNGNTSFDDNSGEVGGVLYAYNSTVDVDGNTSFDDNSAQFGGAIYAKESFVYIDGDNSFGNNSAEGGPTSVEFVSSIRKSSISSRSSGGAIHVYISVVYIYGDTSFTGNSADFEGGAIYADESYIQVDGKTNLSNNFARGANWTFYYTAANHTYTLANGGAICTKSSALGIDGNTVFKNNWNAAESADGGAVHAYFSNIVLNGLAEFSTNYGDGFGGALYAESSEIIIDGNVIFRYNSAAAGGAVLAHESNLSVHGNTEFPGNYGVEGGGAIASSSSNIGIDGNTVFLNNYCHNEGGAVRVLGSKISIDGNALFRNSSAPLNGGALHAKECNVTFAGSTILHGNLPGDEGDSYSKAGDYHTPNWSVAFVDNSAGSLAGAMFLEKCNQVHVRHVMFKSNEASLGGAVYVLAVDDKQTVFSECVLEGNTAADGGAAYLYTGSGVDTFNASVFRNNFARTSGGAIFHTGSMRVSNTSFVANKAGVEGPAVMSVGFLDKMYNVNFSENVYYCRAGEYGYIDRNESNRIQDSFCSSCFGEACSRCSTADESVGIRQEIRIDGLPVCAKPPLGATAPSSGTTVANLTLNEGYFRTSNKSHDIRKCYQERACRGGSDTDKYCASGYTGPYCAVCAKGFAPGIAYSCRECSRQITRSAVGLAVAGGLAVLLFAILFFSYLGSGVHDRAEERIDVDQSSWKKKCSSCGSSLVNMLPLGAIKIVVTVWQIISQFDAIAGDVYPELYQTFVSKLNPINLDLDFILSYSCFVSNDFYDHLVFATITPLVALVVLAGSYVIGIGRNSCSESAMREVRHKHQAVVLFIASFVYSPVSFKIFQTFGCDELDDGGTYLRADYSLSCSAARHSWYKLYAFIMVGVYPFGISAAFVGLLVWNRRDLVKPDRETMVHLKPLNSVWAAYKPSRYYHEIIECARRISLTVIAAFVLPNSTAQLSVALLFAVVYVFISEVLSPFQKAIDTGLYRWGNGVVVASMYVAFLNKFDVGHDTASEGYILTFSGVLVAANLFMVVTVLIQMALLANRMRTMKHSVSLSDVPIRRTSSVSLRYLSPINEGGIYREGGVALESKDSQI